LSENIFDRKFSYLFWVESLTLLFGSDAQMKYKIYFAGMLLESYLGEVVQFVRFASQEFSVGTVTCGAFQDSVLGPVLFISYINEILRVVRY
jgi:hypothetical protein